MSTNRYVARKKNVHFSVAAGETTESFDVLQSRGFTREKNAKITNKRKRKKTMKLQRGRMSTSHVAGQKLIRSHFLR